MIYQGLTMYLLVAIGWQGGEELAKIKPADIDNIAGFMALGFALNFVIGCFTYLLLKYMTRCGESTGRRSPAITGRTRREPSPPAWPS